MTIWQTIPKSWINARVIKKFTHLAKLLEKTNSFEWNNPTCFPMKPLPLIYSCLFCGFLICTTAFSQPAVQLNDIPLTEKEKRLDAYYEVYIYYLNNNAFDEALETIKQGTAEFNEEPEHYTLFLR